LQPSNKFHLDLGQFYITNVCNFNCPGCNCFNNYAFTGSQKWEDYADVYRQWSNILDLGKWAILGGEPFTNPTYLDWLRGISSLWPNSSGELLTNGHYLKEDNRELYNIIHSTNGQVKLSIGLHNINRKDELLSTVCKWLRGSILVRRTPENLRHLPNFDKNWQNSYNAIKDESWPACDIVDDWDNLPEHIQNECKNVHGLSPEILSETRRSYVITDSNGVQVLISYENYFHQGALIVEPTTNTFKLHNSDIKKAHDICHSKYCHHFAHGQLYKCGPVALFKEINQQFNLSVTDEQQKLIHAYKPGNVNMPIDELTEFVESLNNPIAQCTLCPEKYHMTEITANSGKKIKFLKKQKHT
jgi:organic radical activating enzyme